ncbi:hypothetical protein GCM10018952_48210 [Streptosporangium vulgare]
MLTLDPPLSAVRREPWLADHLVDGQVVRDRGAAQVELAIPVRGRDRCPVVETSPPPVAHALDEDGQLQLQVVRGVPERFRPPTGDDATRVGRDTGTWRQNAPGTSSPPSPLVAPAF